MRKKYFKNKKGFTIIETMISISLFLIIVMAGMGALLNANLLHNKSQNTRSIMDNLSFIMEDISRNLRTGTDYHCIDNGDFSNISNTHSCANGGGIAFKSADGIQWVYYIDSVGKIWKSTQAPYNILATFPYIQMTPSEVKIDPASGFSVLGAEPPPGDNQQPFVTIRLVGNIVAPNGGNTPFSLQTSVSQRLVDRQ